MSIRNYQSANIDVQLYMRQQNSFLDEKNELKTHVNIYKNFLQMHSVKTRVTIAIHTFGIFAILLH